LNQPILQGKFYQAGSIVNFELFHQVGAVGIYRAVANEEFIGDFFVGETSGYFFQYFEFTLAQR
jgi:hypothetical protein